MDFFSSLVSAESEANDEVQRQRRLMHVQSTFECLESMEPHVFTVFVHAYFQSRERMVLQMATWTSEVRIRIGRQMQDQARAALNTDVVGSYAKWLAGAWLESGERKSENAMLALGAIDSFEREVTRNR